MDIQRYGFKSQISVGFANHNVVAILGPRQCGKTTIAREFAANYMASKVTFFDMEDPEDHNRLQNPKIALEMLEGLIVIDEIQKLPDLFPIIRVLVDNKKVAQKFLILGSASRELIKQSSESLAGRIAYLELTPFKLSEVTNSNALWLKGGFPKSYLSDAIDLSVNWRENYVKTFLEQDIPNLGFAIPPATMRRFWLMLTHYHGQIFNMSEIGRSLGVSNTAIRNYLGVLVGTFMIRELKPWFNANISKRQVKSPKLYFRDSGIYHVLSGIGNMETLLNNPKLGASWEGYALEEVIRKLGVDDLSCYFWGTHAGAELDLFINHFGKKYGFEFKFHDAPKITASMHAAIEALELDRITVIYPGEKRYHLSEQVEVVGLTEFVNSA